MSYAEGSSSSSRRGRNTYTNPGDSNARPDPAPQAPFEIFDWYPYMQSCHRYFLDHAQHETSVQALALFMNIVLPAHKDHGVVNSSNTSSPRSTGTPSIHFRPSHASSSSNHGNPAEVSLVPYIRRLIVTGFDNPEVLHGFFGDDWARGVGPIHEIERRNYLFAAKSESWLKVKEGYDMNANETVPFMKPLQRVTEAEITEAETQWGDWLAMQDWMIGPRAPGPDEDEKMITSPRRTSGRIKKEPKD